LVLQLAGWRAPGSCAYCWFSYEC